MESQKKCQYPGGWDIKIGPFSMDPCRYQVIEEYPASVSILRCRKCGHSKLVWTRKDGGIDDPELQSKDLELKDEQNGVVRCSPFKGWKVGFLGRTADICDYEVEEHYEDALVSMVECVKCGFRDARWEVTEDPDEPDREDFTEL